MDCGAHHKRLGGVASMILMVSGNMTGVIDSWKMISSNATTYTNLINTILFITITTLFFMENVNECHTALVKNLIKENFYGKKKK